MRGWLAVNNFILFQIGWFACVYSAASGLPAIGTAVAIIIVVVHLKLVGTPARECILLLTAGIVGGTWESALIHQELFVYPAGMMQAWLAPHWIIAMWFMFATTINASLSWLKRGIWLPIVCGALFAPPAYYAGYRLGAVSLPEPFYALTAQAIGWAVLLPLLTTLAGYLEKAPAAAACSEVSQ